MINLTDRPIIAHADPDNLHAQIRSAMDFAAATIDEQFKRTTSKKPSEREAFKRLFGCGNATDRQLDEEFIQRLFHLVQLDSRNTGAGTIFRDLKRFVQRSPVSATGLPVVKRGSRLTLVELWRRRTLLLPTTFTTGGFFSKDLFEHELLEWILTVSSHSIELVPGRPSARRHRNTDDANMPAADAGRLYVYGPRILWTTDWGTPEEVSLVELSTLHRAAVLYRERGASLHHLGNQFPMDPAPDLPPALVSRSRSF
jgi:hypothetical protein